MGRRYQKPTLVLFSGHVDSACGMANAAVGPFYCGGDGNVYIDLAFYRDMQRSSMRRASLPGLTSWLTRLGITSRGCWATPIWRARAALAKASASKSGCRCGSSYRPISWPAFGPTTRRRNSIFWSAETWTRAINAAFQIGDDRLQKQAQGYVVPDAFTHGTSEQRKRAGSSRASNRGTWAAPSSCSSWITKSCRGRLSGSRLVAQRDRGVGRLDRLSVDNSLFEPFQPDRPPGFVLGVDSPGLLVEVGDGPIRVAQRRKMQPRSP